MLEHLVEIASAAAARSTRQRAQDLARLRILDQRVQQVLEADEIVAAIGRDAERAADALERVGGERNGRAAHARCSSRLGLHRHEQRKFVLLGQPLAWP